MDMKQLIGKMDEIEEGAKPDFLDMDKDGDKEEPMSKAVKDKENVDERTDPNKFRNLKAEYEKLTGKKAPAGTSTQSMQVMVNQARNAKKDKEKVDESLVVQADGEEADGKKFGVYRTGGSIGEKKTGKPIKSFATKQEAADHAKALNAGLSKGEKEYYKLKYTVKAISEVAEAAKPDFLDMDKDGDKEKVDESLVVQADGEEAAALLGMLKLAGMAPQHEEPAMEERDIEYDNTPDERIAPHQAAVPAGNDLNKAKTMTKHGYQQGDNPLAMAETAALENKLRGMFESMLSENSK